MSQFSLEQHTGEIVKIFPKASDLFKQRNIEFCCSGDRPLIEAVTENSLHGETIIAELDTAYEEWQNEDHKSTDWEAASLFELVNHVQAHYHAKLADELPGINALVTQVFSVHAYNHPPLQKLYRLYHELQMKLIEHIVKEDTKVFPLILTYETDPNESLLAEIHEANETLTNERELARNLLKEIRTVTNDFTPPAGACATFQLTYARLAELESEVIDYMHVENNILFQKLA